MKKGILLVLTLLSLFPLLSQVFSDLDFGEAYIGSTLNHFFSITNDESSRIKVNISLNSPAFSVSGKHDYTLEAGEFQEHEITFKPTFPISYSGFLTIATTIPGFEKSTMILTGKGFHNIAPVAKNVTIKGGMTKSKALKLDYDFFDADGDREGETIIQWYKSTDQVNWTKAINISLDKSILYLTTVPAGNYLKASLTPLDMHSMPGKEVILYTSTPVLDLPAPSNLAYTIKDSNIVVLTWEAPVLPENETWFEYQIKRQHTIIAAITDPSVLTYTDTLVSDGKYHYSVTSYFAPDLLSKSSNIVSVTIDTKLHEEEKDKENIISSVSNYPSPFSPESDIQFTIDETVMIEIQIVNIKGQLVRNLAPKEYEAGHHRLLWDGQDNQGKDCLSGVYLYNVISPTKKYTRKLWLIK